MMCHVSCVLCHAEHTTMGWLQGEAMDVGGFNSMIRIILDLIILRREDDFIN